MPHIAIWDQQESIIPSFNLINKNSLGRVVSGSSNIHAIRINDSQNNTLATFEGQIATLSPDGEKVAVISTQNNVVRIWQVDDLNGLVERGCDWLNHLAQNIGYVYMLESDRQMCGME